MMTRYPAIPLGDSYYIKVMDMYDDQVAAYDIAEESYKQTMYSVDEYDPDHLKNIVDKHLSPDEDTIFLGLFHSEELVGFLAGILVPSLYSPKKANATEIMWYVKPEHRGKYSLTLVGAFEEWARLRGCKRAVVTSTGQDEKLNQALSRLYKRHGYIVSEVAYAKDLK